MNLNGHLLTSGNALIHIIPYKRTYNKIFVIENCSKMIKKMAEFLGPSTRSVYLITYNQACTIKLAGREEFKKLVLKAIET